jgi:outer membrane protein assembly factor BamB
MAARTIRTTVSILVGAAILLLVMGPGMAQPVSWWKFHGDVTNTGFAADQGELVKKFNWKFDTGTLSDSSCAVVDDRVYVANNAGIVFCLDAFNGSEIWNVTLAPLRGIESSPTVADGVLYIGTNENELYALNASDGSELWNVSTNREVKSSPNVVGDYVYFASYDSTVYCYTTDGEEEWSYTTGDRVHTSIPYWSNPGGDDLVYAGGCDGKLYGLDAYDGSVEWDFEAAYFPSSPTIQKDRVFVGCMNKDVYSLWANNGTVFWNYTTEGDIFSSPAVDGNWVYVGSGKYLYSLDMGSGDLNYRFKTGEEIRSSPAVTEKYVIFGSYDNNLYCLDKSSGEEKWNYSTGGPIYSSPAIYASNIYFTSYDGYVYCLGLTQDATPPGVALNHPIENLTIGKKYFLNGSAWDERFVEGVFVSYDNQTWENATTTNEFLNWNFSLDTSNFEKGENNIWIRVYDGYHNTTLNLTFEADDEGDDDEKNNFVIYLIFSTVLLVVIIAALVYTQFKDKKK